MGPTAGSEKELLADTATPGPGACRPASVTPVRVQAATDWIVGQGLATPFLPGWAWFLIPHVVPRAVSSADAGWIPSWTPLSDLRDRPEELLWCSTAAATKALNNGWGRVGCDLNSG